MRRSPDASSASLRRRLGASVAFLVVGVLVGGAAVWAALTLFAPVTDVSSEETHTLATATAGEVGAAVSVSAAASWQLQDVGLNRATGIVTSVELGPGDEAGAGAVAYRVNASPVVVAVGAVPAYRAISAGAEGEDVRQLQQLLVDLGYIDWEPDGKAGAQTVEAIKEWQRSLHLERTGTVSEGSIIYVPSLPARFVVEPKAIAVGATVGGGEVALRALPDAPRFSLSLTELQSGMIPAGAEVELRSPRGDVWRAVVGDRKPDAEKKAVLVELSAIAQGESVCGDQCAHVPLEGSTALSASAVTVKRTAGIVIPSAAISTTADGATVVFDEAGARIPVAVEVAAKGMSVVTGLDEGVRVRIKTAGK